MNVTVENLAPCRKLLRVEVDSQTVEAEFDKMTSELQRHATLAGFRPGKAPRPMVAKAYARQIEDEVRKKMIGNAYRQAVKDQNLEIVGYPDIEEIQFSRNQPLQFAATVDTAPEFPLPEYKGLPIKILAASVSEADVERALRILQSQRATYLDVDHEAKAGDFVVVNFTGTCEGKRISELAPTFDGLDERKKFWLHLEKDAFVPGIDITAQLAGAKAGEHRSVSVTFPANFVESSLANKEGRFEVDVLQIKERALPALSDAFAKSFGAEDLVKLRAGVRHDLEAELSRKRNTDIRNQILQQLLNGVKCDLPESVVTSETRNVVFDIVRQNRERGITKEKIDEQKEQIYTFANTNAKDRVKAAFLLNRIAAKESIQASKEELAQRVTFLANQYQIPVAKFVRQLEERNGLDDIAERIVSEKVLDFLQRHATIEEVPAPATP